MDASLLLDTKDRYSFEMVGVGSLDYVVDGCVMVE